MISFFLETDTGLNLCSRSNPGIFYLCYTNMKHNADNAQVMPFKAVNDCGQSWKGSQASQE